MLESGQAPINVLEGLFGGAALEELTKMVRDLQITQARRGDGGQPPDRRLLVNQRCLWCDVVGHAQRDYADFGEALANDMVYLSNGRVQARGMRRMLESNTGRGSMKMLMKEVAARHVEAIHYSASTRIRVGVRKAIGVDTNPGFWPVVLETFSKRKVKKGEPDPVRKGEYAMTPVGGKYRLRRSYVPDLRGSSRR